MSQTYSYKISTDTSSGVVDKFALTNELQAAQIAGFIGIDYDGDDLRIIADAQEGDNIAPVVAAHISLDEQKITRKDEIDLRTDELIALGFSYDSKVFSLSKEAQINWIGLKVFESLLSPWPVPITTIDDEEYSLAQANLDAFEGAGLGTKQWHLDTGRALKVSIDAAVDQNALDAIIDNR